MFKNTAGQKLVVFAWTPADGLPKTGDAANLTGYVSKDFGAVTVLGDITAAEMDATNAKGYYLLDLTQAETNADTLVFTAKSSTAGVICVCVPAVVYTGVMLGNVAHGGVAAVLTAERVVVAATTANEPAMKLTGNGTAAALRCAAGATGPSVSLVSTAGDGLSITPTGGHAIVATGQGTGKCGAVVTGGTGAASHGLSIIAGSGHSLNLVTSATGTHAIHAAGGPGTGCGINAIGSAAGINATASTGGNPGILCIGTSGGSGGGPGLRCIGGAAAGSAPAGAGAEITGGASSNTTGGLAGPGFKVTGGAGSAAVNGAATGALFAGGPSNTMLAEAHGFTCTGTGNGSGILAAGAGTGVDFGGDINGSVGAITDPASIADAVWDELRAGHAIAGSFGEIFPAILSVPDAVWDVVAAAHLTPGSTGAALDAAIGDGGTHSGFWSYFTSTTISDPGTGRVRFNTATPGTATLMALDSFTSGGTDASGVLGELQAGDTLHVQDQVDAASFADFELTAAPEYMVGWWRLSLQPTGAGGTVPSNNDTVLLSFRQPSTSAAEIADAILARNLAGGSDGGRTVRDALRPARNRVAIDTAAGTIVVYAEDDATPAWTGTVVTVADALPIRAIDPS